MPPCASPVSRVIALALAAAAAVASESIHLPEPGRVFVGVSASHERFDSAWLGSKRISLADLGAERAELDTASIQLQHGLCDGFALDASTGWVRSEVVPLGRESGLADSRVGVRWSLHRERSGSHAPSIGVRVGAIIQGTYEPGPIWAPGVGASGGEASLLLGRRFATRTTVEADAGYRIRAEGVPDDAFGSLRASQGIGRHVHLSAAYAHTYGIGGRGTQPGSFQTTRVAAGTVYGGIGIDTGVGQFLSVSAGRTVTGRNHGRSTIVGASITAFF